MNLITVSIYERVKRDGEWSTVPVELPKLRKKDGQPSLQDNRQGKFRISWYENRKKQWQTVASRVGGKRLPFLAEAIRQAEDKAWFLNNRHRNVSDPTLVENRKELHSEIRAYLNEKSGCGKTVSAHSHALTEFEGWARHKKRGIFAVDEITKALLKKFFEFLVDGDDDDDGPENCPFTAAHKLMKINAFYRAVFHLEQGKGVIKKSDYKRELKSSKVPEVYTWFSMGYARKYRPAWTIGPCRRQKSSYGVSACQFACHPLLFQQPQNFPVTFSKTLLPRPVSGLIWFIQPPAI